MSDEAKKVTIKNLFNKICVSDEKKEEKKVEKPVAVDKEEINEEVEENVDTKINKELVKKFKLLKEISYSGHIVACFKCYEQIIKIIFVKYDNQYYINLTTLYPEKTNLNNFLKNSKILEEVSKVGPIISNNGKIESQMPALFVSHGCWVNSKVFMSFCDITAKYSEIQNLYSFSNYFIANIDNIHDIFNKNSLYYYYFNGNFIRKNSDGYICLTDILRVFNLNDAHKLSSFKDLKKTKTYTEKYPKTIITYTDNLSRRCTYAYFELALDFIEWLKLKLDTVTKNSLTNFIKEKIENHIDIKEKPDSVLIVDKCDKNIGKYDDTLKIFNLVEIENLDNDTVFRRKLAKKLSKKQVNEETKGEEIDEEVFLQQNEEEKITEQEKREILENTDKISEFYVPIKIQDTNNISTIIYVSKYYKKYYINLNSLCINTQSASKWSRSINLEIYKLKYKVYPIFLTLNKQTSWLIVDSELLKSFFEWLDKEYKKNCQKLPDNITNIIVNNIDKMYQEYLGINSN